MQAVSKIQHLLSVPKTAGVYGIKNTTTGMVYIGSSYNMRTRVQQHLKDLRRGSHCNLTLQCDYTNYGDSAFTVGVVETCKSSQRLVREQYWIDTYQANGTQLYNVVLELASLEPKRQTKPTGVSVFAIQHKHTGHWYVGVNQRGLHTAQLIVASIRQSPRYPSKLVRDVVKGKVTDFKFLYIKHHPRDSIEQVERLRSELRTTNKPEYL